MNTLINHPWLFGLLTAVFLAGFIESGQRISAHYRIDEDSDRKNQLLAIRDGLFLLVSLLLGFTLAFVVPRYSERRELLIQEANAIGTTYLRAETLPSPTREEIQNLLREYVDARLDLDAAQANEARVTEAVARAKRIHQNLWDGMTKVASSDRSAVAAAYMNVLNELIDLHEKRISASEHRIPPGVWFLILSVSAISVFTRGLTVPRRFWLTLVLVPLTIAIVVALIADLDSPNAGIVRLDQRAMQRLKTDISTKP